MKYPKILVTRATGRTGSAVVDELLAKGVPVRALVHSLSPAPRLATAKDRWQVEHGAEFPLRQVRDRPRVQQVQEYGVTERANWRRSFARKAAARKDRSCHLQLCSESV